MFFRDLIFSEPIYKFALTSLILLVILTLASQFGTYVYLELTTHFRLQYFLGAIICALLFMPSQSWKFVVIALLCASLNAASLWPYYKRPGAVTSVSTNKLRLFHANVFEKSRDYQAVLERVKEADADIVVLQELTEEWSKQTEILKNSYPYMEVVPRPAGAGMALLSRYPFDDIQVLTLDSSPHIAMLARVKLNETALTLLSLHPTTPITTEKFRNRNQQFRDAARLLRTIPGPKVLVGDLNTTMWSPYFTELLENAGLREARLGFGLGTTWPEPFPPFLKIAIDHCLVSKEVGVENMEIGATTGSDHRPLIVDLIF
jgi:endonuclease/exonuclease/phosphatase (EEP) superfamily protein YafD